MPLLEERIACLREAGRILDEEFDGAFLNCVYEANKSAAVLVNLLADKFPCFRDEATLDGRHVRFYKRAQILVADLWACFEGEGYGQFDDIDKLTMFAGESTYVPFLVLHLRLTNIQDYRVPQMLHTLGSLLYSPRLESHIRRLEEIPSGSKWEIEIRGVSIWCVELIRREILRRHPEAAHMTYNPTSGDNEDAASEGQVEKTIKLNAILIDFFLYDAMKALEKEGKESIPHHRTRSIWY